MTRRLLALAACGAFALAGCQEPPAADRSPTSPGVASRGAGNGAGTAPASACDLVVPDDEPSVQDGIDAASSGQTVCLSPGTYDEDVTVDRGVTLQGRTAARSGNPATLDGQIEVTAGGDGATIRRLRIAPSETFPGGTFPDPAGVLVKASDVVVEGNVIEGFRADLSDGQGSFTLHGVQVFGTDASNVTVRDNVIRDFRSDGVAGEWPKYGGVAGVKIQAGVAGAAVSGNRITDLHSAGWAWGVVLTPSGSAPGVPSDVTVEGNTMDGLNDGSEFDVFAGANGGRDAAPYPGSAFGIDGGAEADEATVRHNNLLAPNGAESKDQDDTLVAECNWWGDRSGPTHGDNPGGTGTRALERGTATVDYEPWLVSNAPGKACNGSSDGPGGGPGGA